MRKLEPYFYFLKAFDSIPHFQLLSKLEAICLESMYCFVDSQLPRKERTVCCAEWSIFQRFASYFWSTPGVNIGASPFSHLYNY